MKVLIVGGGGREHALCWKIAQSPRVTEVFCAPGNAGIAEVAQCVDVGATDIERLVAFANEMEIGLTVVGPEDLGAAMVEQLEELMNECVAIGQEGGSFEEAGFGDGRELFDGHQVGCCHGRTSGFCTVTGR